MCYCLVLVYICLDIMYFIVSARLKNNLPSATVSKSLPETLSNLCVPNKKNIKISYSQFSVFGRIKE